MPAHTVPFVHAVLFGNGLVRMIARLRNDGTFEFRNVPARKWWLRAGDEDFERVFNRIGHRLGLRDPSALAKPWVDAVEVEVRADSTTRDVELRFE